MSVYWAEIKEKMTKLGTKSVYNILVVPVNHNRESSTVSSCNMEFIISCTAILARYCPGS